MSLKGVNLIAGSMIVDAEGHIIAKSQTEEDEAVIGEIELDECARVRKGNIQTGATSELSRREASDLHSDSNIIRVTYAYTWYKDERRPVTLSFVIHENCCQGQKGRSIFRFKSSLLNSQSIDSTIQVSNS